MGRKTRFRNCPAAGRAITAVECGAGRHTTYTCPEECPFNPFSVANYDQLLDLEKSADEKMLRWIMDHAPNPAEFKDQMRRTMGQGPNIEYFRALAWHGFYRVDQDGETVMGKWAKAGFPGLSSDEQVVMRGKQRMRLALIEIHRVLDDRRLEGVDLLEPDGQPLLMVDRSLAGQAVRAMDGKPGAFCGRAPRQLRGAAARQGAEL